MFIRNVTPRLGHDMGRKFWLNTTFYAKLTGLNYRPRDVHSLEGVTGLLKGKTKLKNKTYHEGVDKITFDANDIVTITKQSGYVTGAVIYFKEHGLKIPVTFVKFDPWSPWAAKGDKFTGVWGEDGLMKITT